MGICIKECENCKKGFEPHARLGKRQRVCGQAICLRWRAQESKRQWVRDNRAYYAGSAPSRRPGYWRSYRREHPEQTERNRIQTKERLKAWRAMFATQDSIRKDPVGYLEGLREGVLFATPDSIQRGMEGILTYLITPGMFATQDSMDGRPKVAG